VLELAANRAELARLKKVGAEMIYDGMATEAEVARILDPLEADWSRLESMASDRGDQLAQEEQRIGLMAAIREANAKMDELEAKLADGTRGRDLRGVKELLKQKSHAEQEIQQLDVKLADIRGRAHEMDGNGHFAAEELMEQVDQLLSRFQRLQSPLERRKAELEESLRWHQLAFDADVELQWIGEKLVGAQSQQLGRSLTDAQLLMKRQEQLSAELDCHQQRVADLLDTGKQLAKDGHICRVEIEQKCDELATAWAKLTGAVAKRRKHLSWALAR
jgi:spectrin beta